MTTTTTQTSTIDSRREWSLPADARSVAVIRSGIRAFAREHGAPDETLAAIALAVSEAVTNAVVHGYVDMDPGTITAVVEAAHDEVIIRVADDGRGMQPRPDSPGLGMGLPLIGQMATSLDIRERAGRGTEVCMTFEAAGVRGPARPTTDVDRLAVLESITRLAHAGGWPGEGVERLAHLLVPTVADGCAVDLLDDEGHLRRLAARAFAPDGSDHSEWAMRRPAPVDDGAPAERALATGQTQIDVLAEPAGEDDRSYDATVVRLLEIRRRIVVPIGGAGRRLGVLVLGLRDDRGEPDQDFVRFGEAVAERVADALTNTRLVEDLRRARDRIERILDSLGEAVTVNDRDGRVVYANQAAAHLLGAESPEEVLKAPPGELAARFIITTEDGEPVSGDQFPGQRLLMGLDGPPLLTRSVHRRTGKAWWLLTKATLLEESGEPLAVNIIEDLTEARANEWRLRFLAEASERLASTLDFERTLQEIADLAVPALADWCGVDVVDADGTLRRLGLAHVDPARVELGRRLQERYPPDLDAPQGIGAVLRGGSTQVWSEIPDELLQQSARDAEHLAILREIGMRSAMIVPMRIHDRTIGVISLVQAQSARAFAPGDVRVAEDLARRAAVAVENARLYTELAERR